MTGIIPGWSGNYVSTIFPRNSGCGAWFWCVVDQKPLFWVKLDKLKKRDIFQHGWWMKFEEMNKNCMWLNQWPFQATFCIVGSLPLLLPPSNGSLTVLQSWGKYHEDEIARRKEHLKAEEIQGWGWVTWQLESSCVCGFGEMLQVFSWLRMRMRMRIRMMMMMMHPCAIRFGQTTNQLRPMCAGPGHGGAFVRGGGAHGRAHCGRDEEGTLFSWKNVRESALEPTCFN